MLRPAATSHTPATPPRESLPGLRFAGRHTDDCHVSQHSHHCAELILVTEHACRVDTPGTSFTLNTRQMLVVPRDTPHNQVNLSPDKPVRTLYVGFTCDEQVFDTALRRVDTRRADTVRELMRVLVAMHGRAESYDDVAASAIVLGLLRTIRQVELRFTVPHDVNPRVHRAVEYIHDHLAEPFSVPRLAQAVSLSPSHLTALFRRQFGCAPMRYALRARMNLACRHLNEPYLSIKEIAARCGYHNQSLFIRQFKQHFGVSPGRWRLAPDRLDGAGNPAATRRPRKST